MEPLLVLILAVLAGFTFFNFLLTVRTIQHVNGISNLFKPRTGLEVNAPAPPFKAITLDEELVTLNSFVGERVLLVFVSPLCGSCKREMPMLEALARTAYQNVGLRVVLVSEANLEDTKKMAQGLKITLPILVASRIENDFARQYNPVGMNPYFCLIHEKGTVMSRDIIGKGDWNRLYEIWTRVPTPDAQLQASVNA